MIWLAAARQSRGPGVAAWLLRRFGELLQGVDAEALRHG
jgi:hypothetical protein